MEKMGQRGTVESGNDYIILDGKFPFLALLGVKNYIQYFTRFCEQIQFPRVKEVWKKLIQVHVS